MTSGDMNETHASDSGENGSTNKHVGKYRLRAVVESVDSECQEDYWAEDGVEMSAKSREEERGTLERTTYEDLIDNKQYLTVKVIMSTTIGSDLNLLSHGVNSPNKSDEPLHGERKGG